LIFSFALCAAAGLAAAKTAAERRAAGASKCFIAGDPFTGAADAQAMPL
jgi:hypothetical protein